MGSIANFEASVESKEVLRIYNEYQREEKKKPPPRKKTKKQNNGTRGTTLTVWKVLKAASVIFWIGRSRTSGLGSGSLRRSKTDLFTALNGAIRMRGTSTPIGRLGGEACTPHHVQHINVSKHICTAITPLLQKRSEISYNDTDFRDRSPSHIYPSTTQKNYSAP